MPILHLQYSGQIQAPNGSTVQVPPANALLQRGPVVQVTVSLGQTLAQQITQQGGTLPQPISGNGLIDTGASGTCIDDAAAQQMGLPVVNTAPMASASHAQTLANVYPIQLTIAGLPLSIQAPQAMGAALAAQGLLVLIGRDVLQHCTLHYNGLTGQITLAI